MNNQPEQTPTNVQNDQNKVTTNEVPVTNNGELNTQLAVSAEPTATVPTSEQGPSTAQKPLLANGADLLAYYQMSTTGGTPIEEPTFKIDPSGTSFAQKFLDKIDCGKSTLYPPNVAIDPFFDVNDDMGNGRLVGINDNPNYQHRTYFRPGIVNSIPVHVQNTDIEWDYDLPIYPSVKGHDEPSQAQQRAMCWESISRSGAINNWDNLPDYDRNQGEDMYGGPMFENTQTSFCYRVAGKEICGSNESYISASGADFERLNVDNNTIKDVFYNMKLANLRFNNNNVRDLYSFVYNYGRRDPLAYNAFMQQLKLVAYCDQIATVYDHIENWNSNCFRRFLVNKDEDVEIHQNNNHAMFAYDDYNIGWCTQRQYQQYLANNQELANWAEDIGWYFVPIKFSSLQNSNLPLGIHALSLCPYPICTATVRSMQLQPSDVDPHVEAAAVWFEPLSAKLDIAGHPNICYVIVDAAEDLETDPANAGYFGNLFKLRIGGRSTNIDNIFEDPSQDPEDFDFEGYLVELVNLMFNDGDISQAWIFEEFGRIDDWQLSPSVMEFLAYLTSMPVFAIRRESPSPYFPNLQNVSLVPMDQVTKYGIHVEIEEPSYIQRCYHILGLVRQRSQVFVTSFDFAGFRRVMYGTRLALGACCAQALADSRNEISVNYHTDRDIEGIKWTLRRRQFCVLFESTYLNSSSTLRPGIIGSPETGILKYIVPRAYPIGTYASMGMAANVREYCNVSDWVNFMTEDITLNSPNYYCTIPDEFKQLGSVINTGRGSYELRMAEIGRNPTDGLLKILNKMMGRSSLQYEPLVYWGHLSGDQRADLYNPMYEPVYITGQYSWSADPWVQCPMYVYNSFCKDDFPLPPVRVLDYTYPIVDLEYEIPMLYFMNHLIVNNFVNYIVVQKWDGVPSNSYNDYNHVPGLPTLNKIK